VKPILVIEQEYSLRGLGLLGERLDASRLPYRRLRAWDEAIDELEAGDFAAIIPMGGNAHAWDEDRVPTLRAERLLLREAVERGVPVLGICLGGQLLARALGGEVRAADEPEIGWREIVPTKSARNDPIFRLLDSRAGVYQWHHDVFEPPPGSTVLASSEAVPNQAFRVDGTEAWGIQFHPEATPALWELWIARHPAEVAEAGVDVDALRTAVYRGAEESLAFRTAFFDAFIDSARRSRASV
jgi:GMP synthase-like glutamine amidotransferase